MSVLCAPGSREVGTLQATSAAVTAATGAIAKKMLFQLNCSSSQPPTIGPSAIAMPAVAPQRPIALARSVRSVNTFEISERVAGGENLAALLEQREADRGKPLVMSDALSRKEVD